MWGGGGGGGAGGGGGSGGSHGAPAAPPISASAALWDAARGALQGDAESLSHLDAYLAIPSGADAAFGAMMDVAAGGEGLAPPSAVRERDGGGGARWMLPRPRASASVVVLFGRSGTGWDDVRDGNGRIRRFRFLFQMCRASALAPRTDRAASAASPPHSTHPSIPPPPFNTSRLQPSSSCGRPCPTQRQSRGPPSPAWTSS